MRQASDPASAGPEPRRLRLEAERSDGVSLSTDGAHPSPVFSRKVHMTAGQARVLPRRPKGHRVDERIVSMHTQFPEMSVLSAGVWQSGLAQVVGGLVVVAILIGAFVFGVRVMKKELPRPSPTPSRTGPRPTSCPGRSPSTASPPRSPRRTGSTGSCRTT